MCPPIFFKKDSLKENNGVSGLTNFTNYRIFGFFKVPSQKRSFFQHSTSPCFSKAHSSFFPWIWTSVNLINFQFCFIFHSCYCCPQLYTSPQQAYFYSWGWVSEQLLFFIDTGVSQSFSDFFLKQTLPLCLIECVFLEGHFKKNTSLLWRIKTMLL